MNEDFSVPRIGAAELVYVNVFVKGVVILYQASPSQDGPNLSYKYYNISPAYFPFFFALYSTILPSSNTSHL